MLAVDFFRMLVMLLWMQSVVVLRIRLCVMAVMRLLDLIILLHLVCDMARCLYFPVSAELHDSAGLVSAIYKNGRVVLLIEREFLHCYIKFKYSFYRELFSPANRLYLVMSIEDYVSFITLFPYEKKKL